MKGKHTDVQWLMSVNRLLINSKIGTAKSLLLVENLFWFPSLYRSHVMFPRNFAKPRNLTIRFPTPPAEICHNLPIWLPPVTMNMIKWTEEINQWLSYLFSVSWQFLVSCCRYTGGGDQMSPQSHTMCRDKKMYSLQQTLQWSQRLWGWLRRRSALSR